MDLKLNFSKSKVSKVSKINDLHRDKGPFKEINAYYLLTNLHREAEVVTKVSSFESVVEYKVGALI